MGQTAADHLVELRHIYYQNARRFSRRIFIQQTIRISKEGRRYLEVTKVSNCKMETPFKDMCFVSADYALFSPSSFIP
jgi:3-phenylpropionate/cinnamic acid dioxygenase small subunit